MLSPVFESNDSGFGRDLLHIVDRALLEDDRGFVRRAGHPRPVFDCDVRRLPRSRVSPR